MARPRKPSNILELTGAFRKNPQRRRKTLKSAERPLGEAPDYFDDQQKALWDEVHDIVPPGILKCADRMSLEVLCILMVKMRSAPNLFTAAEFGRLMAVQGKFGMSPADREKLSPAEDKPDDQFSEFVA